MTAAPPRKRRVDLSGVLLLDKPTGLTSNAAVQRVRHLLAARKAGHTGTLDPVASGVLPICLGEATKLAGFLLEGDKRYRTIVQLGATTDTADSTGRLLTRTPVPTLAAATVERVLDRFRGSIEQVPPMYSALRQSGVRLYELARRGIEVERQERHVEIYELTLIDYSQSRLELDVHCSKGTYIRVLAEDIGRALGCGAYMEALRRTAVGPWTVASAHTLDTLQALEPPERLMRISPMDQLVPELPRVDCDEPESYRLLRGQVVPAPRNLGASGPVRLYDARGVFVGIGTARDDGSIAPRRMFNLNLPPAGRHAPPDRDAGETDSDPPEDPGPCSPGTADVKMFNCF